MELEEYVRVLHLDPCRPGIDDLDVVDSERTAKIKTARNEIRERNARIKSNKDNAGDPCVSTQSRRAQIKTRELDSCVCTSTRIVDLNEPGRWPGDRHAFGDNEIAAGDVDRLAAEAAGEGDFVGVGIDISCINRFPKSCYVGIGINEISRVVHCNGQ